VNRMVHGREQVAEASVVCACVEGGRQATVAAQAIRHALLPVLRQEARSMRSASAAQKRSKMPATARLRRFAAHAATSPRLRARRLHGRVRARRCTPRSAHAARGGASRSPAPPAAAIPARHARAQTRSVAMPLMAR